MLNAQKVEGQDGLVRTMSREDEEEDGGKLNRFEENAKAVSKGDAQWKSLKSRGATGEGQVGTNCLTVNITYAAVLFY